MIIVPQGAQSHKKAGPYSPVLEVEGKKLVLISGCAAQDLEGRVVGDTIEEQTERTILNCEAQLNQAGCKLSDVFKVTVYMKDLAHWNRFNAVYAKYMTEPLPVRTAIQVGLLEGIQVEIEMWAIKE